MWRTRESSHLRLGLRRLSLSCAQARKKEVRDDAHISGRSCAFHVRVELHRREETCSGFGRSGALLDGRERMGATPILLQFAVSTWISLTLLSDITVVTGTDPPGRSCRSLSLSLVSLLGACLSSIRAGHVSVPGCARHLMLSAFFPLSVFIRFA